MPKSVRIIPRLDIKGPNLVKGVHLEGLRVLGKPEEFARYYYGMGADELIYIDVVASLYNRNSLYHIVHKTASEIFIPLTVGGGLRTLEDIKKILRAGADRVSLNTAAIKNPEIIRQASRKFGSSTIVVMIEAIRQPDGRYLAYTDSGREYTGIEVIEWAQRVEELGAGEILLTSVDRDGTGIGYDIELTKKVTSAVSIPVIASGGAGKLKHIKDIILEGGVDAVSIASMIHYDFVKNHTLNKEIFRDEGNIEYLERNGDFSHLVTTNLAKIKEYLYRNNINCRYSDENDLAIISRRD